MADFTKPALTSTYTNFIVELKARDNDIASLFSNGSTFTGTYPVRAIRWNESNNYFERRNSANNGWERMEGASGTHKFVNLETGTLTATNGASITGNATATGQLQGSRLNVTGSTAPVNGLYLPAANEIRLTTNSTDRLTIEASGEVGIGTVDPAYTLDITATYSLQHGSSTSGLESGTGGSGNRAAFIDLVGDTTYSDFGFRILRNASGANASTEIIHRGTGNLILETNEAADMIFKTTDLTRLVIDAGGSVCIGTDTSPDDRLHIKEAIDGAVYLRIENNDGYARFGTDANDSFIDADVHNLRSRDGSSEYLVASSSSFHVKTATQIDGNLTVTGSITGNNTGTAAQADNINIDEANNNVSYQVTFSPQNNAGYNRQYIDTDNAHLVYNPSTNELSGLNISCTNIVASGTANLTASDSAKLNSLLPSASGNRWGVVPFVDTSGVMEAGKFIDFHTSDTTTSGNNGRMECDGTNFKFTKNVIPDGSHDLGSTSARWQNLYVNDLKLSNKGSVNDADGTWGDWTIQEGKDSLFIRNERNGKFYKIDMTEVEM